MDMSTASCNTVLVNRRISPSVSNTESPTPNGSGADTNDEVPKAGETSELSLSHVIVTHQPNDLGEHKTELHNSNQRGSRDLLNEEKINHYIPSPPAITNWYTMSTAATTVTSNIHHRNYHRHQGVHHQHRKQGLPYVPPFVVPPSSPLPQVGFDVSYRRQRQAISDIVFDDDRTNHNVNDAEGRPPICEIQIPTLSTNNNNNKADEFDDDDADTTTSTQNLSVARDGSYLNENQHQNYPPIDYKSMYFASQKQNYRLQLHLKYVHDDNRKLKRQLIEIQKQLYSHLRNKRTMSSMSSSPSDSSYNSHPNHYRSNNSNSGVNGNVPWSIPTSTAMQQQPAEQQQKRPKVVLSSSS